MKSLLIVNCLVIISLVASCSGRSPISDVISVTLKSVSPFPVGVAVHGLGMQMHIGVSASNDEIESGLRQLVSTGLLVHISEVSILVSNWKRDTTLVLTPELSKKQADKYKSLVQVYKESVPPAQRYGITVWGVSDANSWIMPMFNLRDWPLPFDSLYRKKAAYAGFLEGLTDHQ